SQWRIKLPNTTHIHPIIPDPFIDLLLRDRRPRAEEAIRLASTHRAAGVSHANSASILHESGELRRDKKEYYNLGGNKTNKQGKTKIEQPRDLQARLEALGFHVRPLIKTIWSDDGKVAIGRVMEQIFFYSSAQITIARRFGSGFTMQTDATFITSKLRLLLSTYIGGE
ncbi:MAG: hypothetical protein Q9187_009155, partial [Circinaria calcarea]